MGFSWYKSNLLLAIVVLQPAEDYHYRHALRQWWSSETSSEIGLLTTVFTIQASILCTCYSVVRFPYGEESNSYAKYAVMEAGFVRNS